MPTLLSHFTWRGLLDRRDYINRTLGATAFFVLGFYLQLRYEDAMGIALGIPEESEWHLLLFVPLLVELAMVFANPFALLLMFFLMPFIPEMAEEEAAAMAAGSPGLCVGLFLLANALMLVAGLRCMALSARRLRDAGSSMRQMAVHFGWLVLLSKGLALVFPVVEELYDNGGFLLMALVWLVLQCRLLFRLYAPQG